MKYAWRKQNHSRQKSLCWLKTELGTGISEQFPLQSLLYPQPCISTHFVNNLQEFRRYSKYIIRKLAITVERYLLEFLAMSLTSTNGNPFHHTSHRSLSKTVTNSIFMPVSKSEFRDRCTCLKGEKPQEPGKLLRGQFFISELNREWGRKKNNDIQSKYLAKLWNFNALFTHVKVRGHFNWKFSIFNQLRWRKNLKAISHLYRLVVTPPSGRLKKMLWTLHGGVLSEQKYKNLMPITAATIRL